MQDDEYPEVELTAEQIRTQEAANNRDLRGSLDLAVRRQYAERMVCVTSHLGTDDLLNYQTAVDGYACPQCANVLKRPVRGNPAGDRQTVAAAIDLERWRLGELFDQAVTKDGTVNADALDALGRALGRR